MTVEEAIGRIEDHMRVHKIGEYPHLRLAEAMSMAIAALWSQQKVENNDPLTLEELREIDEGAVFIKPPDRDSGVWALVDLEFELCRTARGGLAIFDTYGKTWIAYRRPPEGAQEDHNNLAQEKGWKEWQE